jgi:hypothetical protein
MKKSVLVFMFLITASLPVTALGGYFDWEIIGVGGGWFHDYGYEDGFPIDEYYGYCVMDMGLSAGFGPFGNVPVYVVADAEGGACLGEMIDMYGFIGGGVLFYPIRSLQLGLSLGNRYSSSTDEAGFAWNLSAASVLDFEDSSGRGGLFGLKYSYSKGDYTTKNGSGSLLSSSFTVFVKFGARTLTPKEKAADAEKRRQEAAAIAERQRQQAERERRARMEREEYEKIVYAEEREQIRKRLLERLKIAYPGIEGAVGKAGQELINALPKRSTVAVINIRSRDGGMSDYIATDLQNQLLKSGFTVVEREVLDTILAEQNFQMSGLVDDNSAVSIGKMLAAHIILTGAVIETGAIRRLSIRALNVETGRVETMTNQDF